LAAKYRGKVLFVFVYGREAHAQAEGTPPPPWTGAAAKDLPALTQTNSREEREVRARLFRRWARLADLVLVDEGGDRSVQRLFGAPEEGNAVVVVDRNGRVVFKALSATAGGAERTLDDLASGREPHRLRLLSPKTVPEE
jgi:hypothetical protein